MINIDQNAPLHARQETLIRAPLEKVWDLQTDINHWHEWQPDVAFAKLEGTLAPNTIFRWKGGGINITSRLHTVEPPTRIGWTGDSMGMHAVHNWTLEPHENGTRVITEESLSGWLASIIKLFDRNFLNKSLTKSLQTLKSEAEKRP